MLLGGGNSLLQTTSLRLLADSLLNGHPIGLSLLLLLVLASSCSGDGSPCGCSGDGDSPHGERCRNVPPLF
jgi:hypothetical protein